MRDYLSQQARAWTAPRHLFDAANEYCSGQKIAIPAYSTLQKIISQVVGDEQEHMAAHLERAMSRGLKQALAELVNGTGPLPFRQLRQSARNFTGTELEKELIVYRHIQHWMPEVDLAVEHAITVAEKSATPGRESRLHGAKLKRQTVGSQWLYYCAIFKRDGSKRWNVLPMALCIMSDRPNRRQGLCAGSGV